MQEMASMWSREKIQLGGSCLENSGFCCFDSVKNSLASEVVPLLLLLLLL